MFAAVASAVMGATTSLSAHGARCVGIAVFCVKHQHATHRRRQHSYQFCAPQVVHSEVSQVLVHFSDVTHYVPSTKQFIVQKFVWTTLCRNAEMAENGPLCYRVGRYERRIYHYWLELVWLESLFLLDIRWCDAKHHFSTAKTSKRLRNSVPKQISIRDTNQNVFLYCFDILWADRKNQKHADKWD